MRIYRGLVVSATLTAITGCGSGLDPNRTVESFSTFGEIVYRETCQRIAYTGQLDEFERGARTTVDVQGKLSRAVCVEQQAVPADAPAELRALVPFRADLIETIDTVLPRAMLPDVEALLEAMLPIHDDGTMEKAIAGLGNFLATVRDDRDAVPALVRLIDHDGYAPIEQGQGLVEMAVNYPYLSSVLRRSLGLIGKDGDASDQWRALLGAASAELRNLEPPTAAERQGTEKSGGRIVRDLLLARHPELQKGKPSPIVVRDQRGVAKVALTGGAIPAPFVDGNKDGLADIDTSGRFVDGQGQPLTVPTPFPVAGKSDTTPRDAQGRALIKSGSPETLYEYVDLDGTLLSAVLRESAGLFDPLRDALVGSLSGLPALLGPRASVTHAYKNESYTFLGFDLVRSPALDLAHAGGSLVADKNLDEVLQSTKTLLAKHEPEVSRLVGALLRTLDLGDQHPEAQLRKGNVLADDLTAIAVRVMQVPGLAEDLLDALENPHTRGLGALFGRMLRAKNQVDFNHADGPDYPVVDTLGTVVPVDRNAGDVFGNLSLFQRLIHLIHDANGAKFCNKTGANPSVLGVGLGTYGECELFKIEDLALFHVLTLATPDIVSGADAKANRFETTYSKASFREAITSTAIRNIILDNGLGDTTLELQTGISGFTRFPTPKAAARSIFLRPSEQSQFMQDTTAPVRCNDGDIFFEAHDGVLPALELPIGNNPSGFPDDTIIDALRPVVDAFAKHDECVARTDAGGCTKYQNAAKIFIDSLAVLHEHWASQSGTAFGGAYQTADRTTPRYSRMDNIVSAEPLLADILTQTDVIAALSNLLPALNALTLDGTAGTAKARPFLLDLARNFIDPRRAPAGLTYRDGGTIAVGGDGATPYGPVTPWYVMLGALRSVSDALDQMPQADRDAVSNAMTAMRDQFLEVELPPAGFRFKNRHLRGMLTIVVDQLRDRLLEHTTRGDLDDWARRQILSDATDLVGGPLPAALTDFMKRLEANEPARSSLYGLLSYLVDEAQTDKNFGSTLAAAGDMVQILADSDDLVPIGRILGAALHPETGMADQQVTLLKRTAEVDDKELVVQLLPKFFVKNAAMKTPIDRIGALMKEVNRSRPGQGGSMDVDDWRSVFGSASKFFLDQDRGFLRMVQMVKSRNPQ